MLRPFKRALICPILIAGTQVKLEKAYFFWLGPIVKTRFLDSKDTDPGLRISRTTYH
jgi:hypothetical protein